MKSYICEECGQPLDKDAVFCPHCGAANFQRNTPVSHETLDVPFLSPDAVEIPSQNVSEKSNRKTLFLPVIAALAVLFVGFLIWDPFSSGEDSQLSVNPSAEQTVPSTTSPKIYEVPPTSNATTPTHIESTNPSESVPDPTETEPYVFTLPTQPPADPGTPLSQEQLDQFQQFLTYPGVDERNFYRQALVTTFSNPREMDLYELFYNGIRGELNQLTDKEFSYFKEKIDYLEVIDVHVLPPEAMNDILTEYFGISLAESSQLGLDKFQYWEETGYYYWFGSDSNAISIQVVSGKILTKDTVRIDYTSADFPGIHCITLRITDHGCTVLSNLPA